MEYLQQISKNKFVISSCMMRQNPLFLFHDAVYRDGVYRENKLNKILLQKIEKIPKKFVLTKMQHNLIYESPFMKNQ